MGAVRYVILKDHTAGGVRANIHVPLQWTLQEQQCPQEPMLAPFVRTT